MFNTRKALAQEQWARRMNVNSAPTTVSSHVYSGHRQTTQF